LRVGLDLDEKKWPLYIGVEMLVLDGMEELASFVSFGGGRGED